MFIHWIIECVSTTSFSIALNGSIFRHFKGKRGLYQGDPLSPFLFVICLEYISRLLKINTTESNFNFHPNCTQLGITYLAFADDLMLMSRGDATSVKILIESLCDFGNCSGLKANALKLNLYTAGIIDDELAEIQLLTNFQIGNMPFRYLGIPWLPKN